MQLRLKHLHVFIDLIKIKKQTICFLDELLSKLDEKSRMINDHHTLGSIDISKQVQ